MNKQVSLSKKCASCGIQKPLSAFLSLKTQLGTHYGNLCANCRQTQAKDANLIEQENEDSSDTVNRHTIDNKTKIAIESDKKQRLKETETLNFEENAEQEKTKQLVLEKKLTLDKDEKKYRETFLGTMPTKESEAKQQEQKRRRRILEQQIAENKKVEQQSFEKTHQEINEINLNTPGVEQTNKLKYQGAIFQQFLAWVGEGSALGKNLSQLQQKQTNKTPVIKEPTLDDLTKHISGPNSSRKK